MSSYTHRKSANHCTVSLQQAVFMIIVTSKVLFIVIFLDNYGQRNLPKLTFAFNEQVKISEQTVHNQLINLQLANDFSMSNE